LRLVLSVFKEKKKLSMAMATEAKTKPPADE